MECVRFIGVIVVVLCAGLVGIVSSKYDRIAKDYDQLLHPSVNFELDDRVSNVEKSSEFWLNKGKSFVRHQNELKTNENVAKNVIFFIGDGMSLATLAASRLMLGGEERALSFEKFPYTGLAKTYCLDRTVADSASTATSYLCGVKANYGTIGVSGHVKRGDCDAMLNKENHVSSIASIAMDSGKAAGFATTTRVTHASPAGLYASIADRNWENDSKVKEACKREQIPDIAYQLIHGFVGSRLKVILGGGRREFRDIRRDPEEGKKGLRKDGRDLIKEWLDDTHKYENRSYVYNREQLLNVDPLKTDRLMGLFQDTHMLYHLEAKEEKLEGEKPTLAEMTKKAIEVLKTNEKGFFLFVEGGKIDIAHHSVRARLALDETVEFAAAVEVARNITSTDDTLIVVSSDHSHTMSISGYPKRFNDIFGVAKLSGKDKLPYLTLSYANGKAFHQYYDDIKGSRVNPESVDRNGINAQFPSTIPMRKETHGGEDVAVFASGPFAHLFTGVYEQNVLPHLMAYASCIGDGHKACA